MAKKKYKKRQHSPTVAAKRQQEQEKLADEKAKSGKRFDPTARALLFTDLIFLAITAMLDNGDIISNEISILCSLIGVVLLLAALWFQFGGKRKKSFGQGPRL